MEAFPQVIQEGGLTRVGVQENKILDANAIPGRQGGLHVSQDTVTPLLQALGQRRKTLVTLDRGITLILVSFNLKKKTISSVSKKVYYFLNHRFTKQVISNL